MRQQAFAEVLDGLQQRSAAVLIIGLGGNGKTSVAREIAAHCLHSDDAVVRFDAVVWVSDKDRPGTTNLSIVLDEIARTLDYPGFAHFEHEEKQREVEQLLRRQRVLLIVDNFETVTDNALLTWLLRLPEPSKVIITTREYRREFRRGGWPVELRGMSEDEAWELMNQRMRTLRIEHIVADHALLEPLLTATGGNPKAIGMTLGLIKYERRPLQQIVEDLYAARGELFADLFTRAWSLLDETAQKVILAMTFFPDSAGSEALAATADMQPHFFDRARDVLSDLALLDVQQADLRELPRYTLHPLVRSFLKSKLLVRPGFELDARERLLAWYRSFLMRREQIESDTERLNMLDVEHHALFALGTWAYQHHRFVDALSLVSRLEHYYFVRGIWDKKLKADLICIEAARAQYELSHEVRYVNEEVKILAFHVQILSKQGDIEEATKYLSRLKERVGLGTVSGSLVYYVQNAIAIYWMACGNLDAAIEAWQKSLREANGLSLHEYTANRSWLGSGLYLRGRRAEARTLLQEVIVEAQQSHFRRILNFARCALVALDLDEGNTSDAAMTLDEVRVQAAFFRDHETLATIQRLTARLHILCGNLSAARLALIEAINLCERLGMRRELSETRQTLVDLDARVAADKDTVRA